MMNLIVIGLLVLTIVMMSGCIKSETIESTRMSEVESYNGQLYYSLLVKINNFDESVDFKDFRLSYTETSLYQPYFDDETTHARKEMLDALRDKQYDKALKNAQSILNKSYVDINSHLVSYVVYNETNNSEKARFHMFVANGLIMSILNHGNGKSPETAYTVIDVSEEYALLNALNLELKQQRLMEINNHSYDYMEIMNPETGETEVRYFNVDIPYDWLKKQIKSRLNETP